MNVLPYLLFGFICASVVVFVVTGIFCIVCLNQGEKEQEDQDQMQWLRDNMERKSARKKPKMYMK